MCFCFALRSTQAQKHPMIPNPNINFTKKIDGSLIDVSYVTFRQLKSFEIIILYMIEYD